MTRRRRPAEDALRERAAASAADRYRAVLDEVAGDLQCEPDSELCKHVAMLRMVRDNMTAAAIRGERVAVADVRELDAALKAYLPERETLQITTRFVEGVIGRYKCRACGEENHLSEGEYTPAAPKTFQHHCPQCGCGTEFNVGAPFADGDPGKLVTPPEPEAPTGVRYREGVSGSALHSMVLDNDEIPPLEKDQAVIGAYAPPRNVSPMSVDTHVPRPRRDNAPAGSALDEPNPFHNGKG
jgi:hypothetical protein